MKKLFLLFLTLAVFKAGFAQLNQTMNASEILQAMYKLNTLGSVLYIAAHPDDENTRLLAYLANEKKFRTGYLSITRGDGGQNLIGKEQGELLGLIRTQELLAARRTDGAEQFFTRANDFGYSKNPEETFVFWNKDSIMADVVYTIRKFRPDVIICRFPTTGEGGHGHHTASAMLAVEAFELAADPTKFPEQLKTVQVWQAKRLFWNTFNFGTTNTTSPDQLKIDAGAYNPLLGKNYGEIASESRSMHKSQGFGSARQRGENIEFFKFLKGEKAETDIFEDVSGVWDKIPSGGAEIAKLLEQCIASFQPASPEKSLATLVDLYGKIQKLDEKDANAAYWKKIKLKETEKLILACSGLWLETFSSDYMAIPGQDMNLTTHIVNRNKNQVKVNSMSYWKQTDTSLALDLKNNVLYTFKHKEKLSAQIPFSNPYWLNAKHSSGLYTVSDLQLIGQPENTALTKVFFKVNIEGLEMEIERPVVYKNTDPVKGEVYRPLEILPPATVNISEKVFVFTNATPRLIQLKIKANMTVSGTLQIAASQGWIIKIEKPDFKLAKGDEVLLDAILTPGKTAENGTLKASLLIEGNVYNKAIQRIEYDHIPYQFFLTDAESGLIHVELKKTATEIAYIPGAGDDIPAALKQIGYNVTILTDELLASSDLSKYKAIITGIRAYNTNERLQLMHVKLMEYVKKGGNLVVQYNTNSRVGPLQTKIGPYPFTISRDRVTNEQAEVKFRKAAHPVLNTPNKISSADFEGWIQERGIYFATEVDSAYTSVLSMNDPGEKASDGSLIIAAYGKGNFVYTGLAFFRELPAGVPGAYRLFVNILSLPPHP